MDKVLIIHGWGGNSNENWFPWLQKKLNSKFFDVYVPNLPNTNNPVLEEQEEYIDIYASDFKNGGYIIGHSLGCQLAVNFTVENNINNSIIILIAPTYPGLAKELGEKILGENYEAIKKYYDSEINFDKLNSLKNKYYIFLSDNDPYINMNNAKKYYSNIKNIEFIDFKNMGHFNKNAGVLELNEILDYIK